MTELTPGRWLLFAGTLGVHLPWVVHWSDGFSNSRPEWHHYYVLAYFGGIAAAIIAFVGAGILLYQGKGSHPEQTNLSVALGLGLLGLWSATIVLFLSMM